MLLYYSMLFYVIKAATTLAVVACGVFGALWP